MRRAYRLSDRYQLRRCYFTFYAALDIEFARPLFSFAAQSQEFTDEYDDVRASQVT